MFLSIRNN